MPLWQSEPHLPDQAAVTQGMGHVTMGLLGAESIVSRAPQRAAWYGPGEFAIHQGRSEASALPQDYARQFPSIPPAVEHFWQGHGEQLQQQPLQFGSYQPSMVIPIYAQHAQQQRQPGWTADACTVQVRQCEAQATLNYQAEADTAAGGWPMPDHLVIPSLQVPQQQQQKVCLPTVKDFNSADFHAADAVSADDDGHDHWQSTASASSRTSDTETDNASSGDVDEQNMFGDVDEQNMFEPSEAPSKAGNWVEDDVPQVQLMSRDVRNDHGHKDLLHQHQLKIFKKGRA